MAETHEQQAFIRECEWKGYRAKYVIAAIPNQRHASVVTGRRFKAEGVLAGFPDIGVFEPRAPYHGLFIEFKFGKNKLSPEQKAVRIRLEQAGYRYVVSYSAMDAIKELEEYLKATKK